MSDLISTGSRKLLIFLLILIGFPGCGGTVSFVVKQYPMKEGMVPNFAGLQPVNVINAQDATDEILIGEDIRGVKYLANLQKWTDIAINILKTELHKRNIVTTTEAEKKIKLAITMAKFDVRWAVKCTVDLKVETGDGYSMVFTRENRSASSYQKTCGRAVLWAVAAMLNDDTILAYLKH